MTKDEIVKQEIVLKAQVLFQQFGLKKTTMDEIAHACGKAKSTLYHYFKSKEEVFEEVLKMEITNLRKLVKSEVDDAKNIKDKALTYFMSFHHNVINKINLYRSISLDLNDDVQMLIGHNQAKRAEMLKQFLNFECDYLTRLFDDAFDAGEFTKIPKEDIPFFSEMILASFMGIMRYTIETDSLKNKEKLDRTAFMLASQIFS